MRLYLLLVGSLQYRLRQNFRCYILFKYFFFNENKKKKNIKKKRLSIGTMLRSFVVVGGRREED